MTNPIVLIKLFEYEAYPEENRENSPLSNYYNKLLNQDEN